MKEFHKHCVKHAKIIYLQEKRLPAHLVISQPDGSVILLDKLFTSEGDKQYTYDLYASILQAVKGEMYSFISESWFYAAKDRSQNPTMPSEHPGKKTALLITTATRESALFTMYVEQDGKFIKELDENTEFEDGVDLFGRVKQFPQSALDELKTIIKINTPDWYHVISNFMPH